MFLIFHRDITILTRSLSLNNCKPKLNNSLLLKKEQFKKLQRRLNKNNLIVFLRKASDRYDCEIN